MRPRPLFLLPLFCAACPQASNRPGGIPPFDAGIERDARAARDAEVVALDAAADAAADSGPGSRRVHTDYGVDFVLCPPGRVPIWGNFVFMATVPAGTHLRFLARTSETSGALDDADDVVVGNVPGDESPIYLDDLLPETGRHWPFLRVTTLLSWDDAAVVPELTSTDQEWVCVDDPG